MKKVLILAGGYSKEREISLQTANSVYKELNKIRKYKIKIIEPDGNLLKNLRNFKPNTVLNLLHGRYGEDGYIQTILEAEKIKYTHSGVLSSSLAMDKEVSKKIYKKNKINTPKHLKFTFKKKINNRSFISNIQKKLKFPVVIKPISEGSSVNVYICTKKNFLINLYKLKSYGEVLIEKYITGREIQVAVLNNKVLGAIELKPRRKFYDYKAKYNRSAKTEHIIPVDLNKKDLRILYSMALKAHKILHCRGVTRSDFRYDNKNFYLLETNTQPGMTSLSLVPEIARYYGTSFRDLLEVILKDASINK
tara:strand:+ start:2050 stop:2970 length:921 start_codon:yes stop_codon:yes gene_type:complete